jgi:hypothetical protein
VATCPCCNGTGVEPELAPEDPIAALRERLVEAGVVITEDDRASLKAIARAVGVAYGTLRNRRRGYNGTSGRYVPIAEVVEILE